MIRNHADQCQREDKQRESKEDIHRPCDDPVEPSAEVTGDDPEEDADRDGEERGEEGDEQGILCAVHDPAEHIPAVDGFHAQWMRGADTTERPGGAAERRIDELLVEGVR
jgi:hypothetical protein